MSHSAANETDLQRAIARHKAGDAVEAERLYRAVLLGDPHHAEANHNLAVLLAQRGDVRQGLPLFKAALQAAPAQGQYWLSYAKALLAAGQSREALTLLRQGQQRGLSGPAFDALLAQAQPDAAESPARAAARYRDIAAREPDNAAAHEKLGHALAVMGQFGEAEVAFRAAAALQPRNVETFLTLGNVCATQGKPEEAIAAYRRTIAIDPACADAHFRLGSLLSESGHIAEGFAHYMRRAELVYGADNAPPPDGPEGAHKRKHDREQREHLGIREGAFHLAEGERLAGAAVNPANATAQMLAAWRDGTPQMVVIEDFLMPLALEKLRRYCTDSTIWRRVYDAGYIGATPQDGFACPLLAQIAEEIRATFPQILGAHDFHYLGAFKYDSALSTGTNTHADNAAVNVNFYITPDEANRDPQSGGMDIWNVSVPSEEAMRRYNGDEAAMRAFLLQSNAAMTRVPHRANRAVIFRSDLVHKTSACDFAEGYLNKRINVSLLFGKLGAPTR